MSESKLGGEGGRWSEGVASDHLTIWCWTSDHVGSKVPQRCLPVPRLPHQFHVQWLTAGGRLHRVLVHVGDMLGQSAGEGTPSHGTLTQAHTHTTLLLPEVIVCVTLIPDEPQEVKTRQQGSRQLDVGLHRLLHIVAAVGRVGCRQDGHSGIEGGHDSCLYGKGEGKRGEGRGREGRGQERGDGSTRSN